MKESPYETGSHGHLANSGRPILYPEGLQGAPVILGHLAEQFSLRLMAYPLQALQADQDSRYRSGVFDRLLNERPALFILPTSVKINGDFLKFANGRPSVLASVSTGTDHVDLGLLREHGVPFLNAPGVNALSVAQYVMAAIDVLHPHEHPVHSKLSVGIVGYGHTGKRVGMYLSTLGIRYHYFDPFIEQTEHASSLDEVLLSDIVTFHVPLTTGGEHPTHMMVDESYLNRINPHGKIINTSRGKIFSGSSYLKLCRNHPCVMDVFPEEPPTEEYLEAATYATPHIAGYNFEARVGGTLHVAREFARLLGKEKMEIPMPQTVYDHNVLTFIPEESRRLKASPNVFLHRRSTYSPRGEIGDLKSEDGLSDFAKQVYRAHQEIFKKA